MFVKLKLKIIGSTDSRPYDPDAPAAAEAPRSIFWRGIRRAPPSRDASRVLEGDDVTFERAVRDRFPFLLEYNFNRYVRNESSSLNIFRRWRPPIRIFIVNISYGSMEFLLSIVGITNDAVQQQVLEALLAFAPIAFSEIVGRDAPLEAEVAEVSRGSQRDSSHGNMKVNALWALTNGSLLVPFGLSLYVLYVTFNALVTEKSELNKERSELLSAIAKQNTDLFTAIVNQSKDLATSAKAMQDLQSSLVQEQAKRLSISTSKDNPQSPPSGVVQTKSP